MNSGLAISILSDSIGSGKTSYMHTLQKSGWMGIRMPGNGNDRILEITPGQRLLSLQPRNGDMWVEVGRYKFRQAAFKEAGYCFLRHWQQTENTNFYLDEIGPLELAEEGFYDLLSKILATTTTGHKLLIVMRQSHLELLKNKFNLSPYPVFSLSEIDAKMQS